MKKILVLVLSTVFLLGCTEKIKEKIIDDALIIENSTIQRQDSISRFRNDKGYMSTGFYLKYKKKVFYVVARHAVVSEDKKYGITWNEQYKDVYVMDTTQTEHYLEPSSMEFPYGTLENERGREGFPVTFCGYDKNGNYVEKTGLVCGRVIDDQDDVTKKLDVIWTTAEIEVGMSGGPVLDQYGKVIGVCTVSKYPKKGKIGFARSGCTPIEIALERMEPKNL